MQLIGITRETKLGQYCAKADWASAHGLQYQTKPNQEGVLVLNKQIVFGNIISVLKKKHISSEISTRTWKPLTLPYEKSNTGGEQKLTQYLLTEEDMTRISPVNRFLTKLDGFPVQQEEARPVW